MGHFITIVTELNHIVKCKDEMSENSNIFSYFSGFEKMSVKGIDFFKS